MPNLTPPITTIESAKRYKNDILKALPKGSLFNPLMTAYLTENMTCDVLEHGYNEGIFFAAKNQIVDNKTLINHLSPDCTSNQTYKAILTDNAKASYLSKTFVDRKAQKTEGYQLSKGILLSRDSYFHSKPELKIYANDVKCSHGSTIGPFDDDMLFYLRTRGLDLNQAKSFLIKSFCMSLLDNIEEKTYKIEAIKLADKWLKKNSF